MAFETISVIGLGYIGLPTAAMFASCRKQVIGIDVNEAVIQTINKGCIHIIEPELETIVKTVVHEGYLRASATIEPADAFLIAVPTPFSSKDKQEVPVPDLSYIQTAVEAIAPVLEKGNLVILESTSPVGTTEQVVKWFMEKRPDLIFPTNANLCPDINVAYCPERVLPGYVVQELVSNDRVIGGMTLGCAERAIELYKLFVHGECIKTNVRTAEMVKLTENSCRDVQIAFANELSLICDHLQIDVWELIALANRHPRVNILQPGPGVGGHCIAVDPWFIVSKNPEEAQLIHTARKVNDHKPYWIEEKVLSAIKNVLEKEIDKDEEDVVIAFYGLTFKQDIDDLRGSPALNIVQNIANRHHGKIYVVEPNIQQLPVELIEKNVALIDFGKAGQLADVHVLLVNHKSFKKEKRPVTGEIIDTKGIW